MCFVKRFLSMAGSLAILASVTSITSSATAVSYSPTVGIWYSTWYAKEGVYQWVDGHGYGSVQQLVSDVNGDGKEDAIVCFADGSWYVSLSTGNGFGGYSCWRIGHGISNGTFLSNDVNGDGKADAVTWDCNGLWSVALSTGDGFAAPQNWQTGFGNSTQTALTGDVNGDGKADAVLFSSQGAWTVALSNGSGFSTPTQWVNGHGYGSASQLLEDVNGDNKADAVVFFSGQGSWYVSLSLGNAFGAYAQWITGHGANSTKQLLADVNGDGKKDAVYYTNQGTTGADWYWARSIGSAFQLSEVWKMRHGYGCTGQLTGNIFGDGTDAPIAYFANTGRWKALPANLYYVFPNIYNTWEAGFLSDNRPISYVPHTLGSYRTYDSGETAVIDEHLSMMAQAGIDYLLFDLTNFINADNQYIKNRALQVAKRIQVWNSNASNRSIRYAVGIGYMQLTHNAQTMEDECAIVYNEFVNTAFGGTQNYYYVNGKPLIVSYAEYADRLSWEKSAIVKTASSAFSVRWMQGGMAINGIVPATDFGLYYGWSYPNGSLPNADTMVVMPGHNNQVGNFISRQYQQVNGGFYGQQCWQKVLLQKPQNVVINSFNEFAEETAVQPADTSGLTAPSEKWFNTSNQLDAEMYWHMTAQYIAQLRQ